MKIAVTYDNGNVFQHFGRTEQFKIYEVKEGEILGAVVIGTNGIGHEALAEYLKLQNVDLLICGGMGEGAQAALKEAGITVYSGAQGSADEAVASFLAGTLESQGVNCDHHDHEHSCGHHEENAAEESEGCACGDEGCNCGEEGCGCGDEEEGCGGCGGGCGGCHSAYVPDFEGPNIGKTVRVHYEGTLDDGSKFDSSYDRDQPLEFVCGAGMMIHGFDKAVATMEVGQTIDVHLTPDEAYGEQDPSAIIKLAITDLPGSETLNIGEQVYLRNQYGQRFAVTVTEKDDTNITLDANHHLAGKALNFKIQLVDVL